MKIIGYFLLFEQNMDAAKEGKAKSRSFRMCVVWVAKYTHSTPQFTAFWAYPTYFATESSIVLTNIT